VLLSDLLSARVYRVLIVDDERSIREFCKAVSQAEGLRCDEATDTEEALRKAAEHPPGSTTRLGGLRGGGPGTYDGTGYPDRLAGEAIPLAARVVALCDVYDALRCRRSWKPALAHAAALQRMTEAMAGQFDPALVQVFQGCASEFDRIFQGLPG
jgi:response regulator RpfG family c-di-GMP phosphodiesterase